MFKPKKHADTNSGAPKIIFIFFMGFPSLSSLIFGLFLQNITSCSHTFRRLTACSLGSLRSLPAEDRAGHRTEHGVDGLK